ncbi:DNA alkylation repair protein [Stieleria sp. JC731]|nr:DNA alkylation repair protein [Stieleria sp. JC731]MCC9599064.1 DNA alkylation repair protein [Stieleria sp. JC731]
MGSFSLKDHLFNRETVTYLADQFQAADSSFDHKSFVKQVLAKFKELELKQRITHIAEVLEQHLSSDYKVAAKQIVAALPPKLDESLADDDFGDFILAPLGEYVVRNGLDKKQLRLSLKTLKEITQRFSMEDAIRAFIRKYPEATIAELEKWSVHRNYHVRRLVSEGTRPSLPWSGKVPLELTAAIPLLDQLHSDRTRYVTRSVANHLNDISKKDPDLVLTTLQRWRSEQRQDDKELTWMTKHALRTLVKQGHPSTLKFLGYRPDPKITVSSITLENDSVKPGESLEFSFSVDAERDESLIIDYVIDFVKSNGGRAGKVFKIGVTDLKRGATKSFSKRHKLHANATTFTLYPGTHQLSVQINGKIFQSVEFELLG